MAGKIPVGDFNTRISLDGEQPIQTLKSLKNEVSSATSAWKAIYSISFSQSMINLILASNQRMFYNRTS